MSQVDRLKLLEIDAEIARYNLEYRRAKVLEAKAQKDLMHLEATWKRQSAYMREVLPRDWPPLWYVRLRVWLMNYV